MRLSGRGKARIPVSVDFFRRPVRRVAFIIPGGLAHVLQHVEAAVQLVAVLLDGLLGKVELVDVPFEKTPKMSIKRYLYQ